MVTILVGSNSYLIRQRVKQIERGYLASHDALSVIRLEANEIEVNDLTAAVSGVSLFAEDKLIILENPSENKDIQEAIESAIATVDDAVHLVIVEGQLDKRSAYYKMLKKQSGFQELSDMNDSDLKKWVTGYVSAKGGAISLSDSGYLIERCGTNQRNLQNELDKIVAYDTQITRATIELLTEPSLSSTIFNLIDEAFSGRVDRALRLYDEQRSQKVEPQAILGMLIWQMHATTMCAAYGSAPASKIASDAGMNPYVIGKAQKIARSMGVNKIREYLRLLRDIDYAAKHQTYNLDDALKLAILKLA